MRVLYFHQHFSTPKGAAGIRSYQMARQLIEHGHEITMVCGSYGGGETGLKMPFRYGRRQGFVDGIRVIEFDLNYSNNDSFVKRVRTFIKFALRSISLAFSEKYDVLFATTTPLTAGIPGIFARWLRGKPFVFEVRDLWPELPREMGAIKNPVVLWLMSLLEWASYRSANRCIGLSPGIVEGIANRGVEKTRIALVPNGCDLSIFCDEVDPWRPVGVCDSDLMAIFTGTHGVANGLEIVLGTAAELKRRGRNDIKMVLVGQGKCKNALQHRVKIEGLGNVIFHPPVNKMKLAGLMAGADIGLQILANVPAFYFGTSPNKFFDYISSGLPVLNNYPGWLAEMIEDHQCGFVVPPESPVAFADALESAMDEMHRLVTMGQNSRRLAELSFDRKHLANEWVEWVTGAV
ncbi:glycosyltransferase family 4 protein [Desulfoluna butyratoxydans]|uniref:Glycosyl transferases group 1 n=1 Tax=Desulfoluna butyratoxydans TaxID=231438 RepID=A0A4V6IM37_9BACT|nr:glycosyltransferase family 4 protein [Desulfoluna butyratoxydans]VFQ47468.1 glycosyl transferases group 1 [Desulfoluna butyratoxydans]